MLTLKPYVNQLPFRGKLARFAWNIVWSVFFQTTPSWCLRKWRVFLLRLFRAKVGQGCVIHPSCKIWAPWNLDMGAYVCLSHKVDCYSVAPVRIGNKVCISQRAFICTASHDISDANNTLIHSPIRIDSFAWVAAQAFVGPGVTVGEGAVIGACAVVTKDVEPWTVVAGNPTRVIGKRVIRKEQ
jgi:putative colanic acid biosynthesis acetyltransferase WcaF